MLRNIKPTRTLLVAAACLLLIGCCLPCCEAYTTSHDLRKLSKRKIWNIPTTITNTPALAQDLNMLKKGSTESETTRGNGWKLSQAAIHSVDATIAKPLRPATKHPLAYGLLSPEIVSRMEDLTEGGQDNRAVRSFLQTYRRNGPMSCLELLSDPEVLPHLTSAMRDIV